MSLEPAGGVLARLGAAVQAAGFERKEEALSLLAVGALQTARGKARKASEVQLRCAATMDRTSTATPRVSQGEAASVR